MSILSLHFRIAVFIFVVSFVSSADAENCSSNSSRRPNPEMEKEPHIKHAAIICALRNSTRSQRCREIEELVGFTDAPLFEVESMAPGR